MSRIKPHKPMPPLSVLDHVLYWLAFLVLCFVWFGLIIGFFMLRKAIAFGDLETLAYHEHASMLWAFLPWFVIFLGTFSPWVMAYEGRRPIFGLKDWKYGQPGYPPVYPLFAKNKHSKLKRKHHGEKSLKTVAPALILVLALLVVCAIPALLSIFGRNCLQKDGTIVEYSVFNTVKREFSPQQLQEVRIEAFRYSTGRYGQNKHWGVRMVYATEQGKTYTFDHRDFRKESSSELSYWLVAMMALKDRYDPAIVQYEGIENLQAVIMDRGLSKAEQGLLRQLFEE